MICMYQHFHKIYILYDLLLVSEYPDVLAYLADPYCRRLLRNICIPHLLSQPVLYIANLLSRLLLHCLEESILSGMINTLTKSSTLNSSTIGLCASTAIDSFQSFCLHKFNYKARVNPCYDFQATCWDHLARPILSGSLP